MPQREQLCNNVRKLCSPQGLACKWDKNCIYISTEYEIFCFELEGQDVWFAYREVKGLEESTRMNTNQFMFNPRPGAIIKTVLDNTTIKTQDQYVELYYQQINKLCRLRDMACDICFDKIFIRTMAEEFYIRFNDAVVEKIELMHRGFGSWKKISDEYHKQFHKSINPEDVVEYIRSHTKHKYGV